MTAVPLLSYTLFSLMSTLDMLGHNRRPSFIMSLTGATETVRNQTALLYTNLFKRSLDMIKNDYMDIHIMPEDHISDVIYKTLRGKDSVVIAFSPDKRRCSHLKKIYTQTHMEDDYTVNGLLLLIKAAKEEIPFPTVNINLPSDFDIEAIKNHFFEADEDEEKDLLLDDIYRFIHFWLKKISNGTDMKKLYREFSGGLKENEQFASLTEDAQEVVSTLRFSLELYLRYRKDKEKLAQEYGIENLDTFCTDILIEVAKDAFPMPNDVTYSALEEAKELCRVLDQYFAK